jgi:hypothetical protein
VLCASCGVNVFRNPQTKKLFQRQRPLNPI